MTQLMETGIKKQIIEKAKEFGACAVGIAIRKSASKSVCGQVATDPTTC